MAPTSNNRIWIPGELLEYPSYEESHLIQDWATIYAGDDPRPIMPVKGGILGVVSLPDCYPSRIASVDLCEVLRETHLASALALGKNQTHISSRVWLYTTLGLERNVSPELVKAVMNADLVKPVEQINDIRQILQDWKDKGIYVVANTSTLPNCEQATIRNLLARDLPGCFDGIVLPRNYHGEGAVTKGDALRAVAATIVDIKARHLDKALHIDDAPYHLASVGAAIGDIATESALIMPTYKAGEASSVEETMDALDIDSSIITAGSPLEAFQKATQFLLDD